MKTVNLIHSPNSKGLGNSPKTGNETIRCFSSILKIWLISVWNVTYLTRNYQDHLNVEEVLFLPFTSNNYLLFLCSKVHRDLKSVGLNELDASMFLCSFM